MKTACLTLAEPQLLVPRAERMRRSRCRQEFSLLMSIDNETNVISEVYAKKPSHLEAKKAKLRTQMEIFREKQVALFHVENPNQASRKKFLGYQLKLLSDSSPERVFNTWNYDSTELRWAKHAIRSLCDAQNRNVLSQRSQWKPYDSRKTLSVGDAIESRLAAL